MEDLFIKMIAGGSVLIAVFILSFLLAIIFKSSSLYSKFLQNYGIWVIFWASLLSSIGSLILSMWLDLPPCDLCWYQRIFMYPIVFISGLAIFNKDYKNGSIYSMFLAIVGAIFAFYHFLLQRSEILSSNSAFCSLDDGLSNSIDCSVPYFIEFGFVSIPFMSLVFFLLIIIASFYARRK